MSLIMEASSPSRRLTAGPEGLATQLYQFGQFSRAHEVLEQLKQDGRAGDVKVEHNSAIAAFRALPQGGSGADELLAKLLDLVRIQNEVVHGNDGGGRSALPHPALPLPIEGSDAAMPALNAAVILWRLGRRDEARALALSLWPAVDALPGGSATQTQLCCLLLDSHLDAGRGHEALQVAAYMDATLVAAQPELALTCRVGTARAHALIGDHRAAKRELKAASALVTAMQQQGNHNGWVAQVQAHCLKAQQELGRANWGKTTRLLAAAQSTAASEGSSSDLDGEQRANGPSGAGLQVGSKSLALRVTLAANGGTLLHAQGRHASAAVAYNQALSWAADAAEQQQDGGGGGVAMLTEEQRAGIVYATGADTCAPSALSSVTSRAHLPISSLLNNSVACDQMAWASKQRSGLWPNNHGGASPSSTKAPMTAPPGGQPHIHTHAHTVCWIHRRSQTHPLTILITPTHSCRFATSAVRVLQRGLPVLPTLRYALLTHTSGPLAPIGGVLSSCGSRHRRGRPRASC